MFVYECHHNEATKLELCRHKSLAENKLEQLHAIQSKLNPLYTVRWQHMSLEWKYLHSICSRFVVQNLYLIVKKKGLPKSNRAHNKPMLIRL